MADLRGVREGLGLAAAAVGGERAWRVDGVAVGLERPELGGLGEGAPADAADAGEEALPGARRRRAGRRWSRPPCRRPSLEREPLACQLEHLVALREVALAGRGRRRGGGGRRGGSGKGGRDGEKAAAAVVKREAAAERGEGGGGGRGHEGGGWWRGSDGEWTVEMARRERKPTMMLVSPVVRCSVQEGPLDRITEVTLWP